MLNEWQEFLDYTGPVTYTGNKSKDTPTWADLPSKHSGV